MATRRTALRQHRRALGYSQETLAQILNVDRTTVVRWERGVTEPQPRIRPRIAATLRIRLGDLDRLLSDTPPSHIPPLPFQRPTPHRNGTNPAPGTHVKIIIEAAAGHTRQPTAHAIITALITDPHGNILLVKPAYRRRWTLPGATVAGIEPPPTARARIPGEDLTPTHPIGDLLVVDWTTPPTGTSHAAIHLLLDGGTAQAGATIHLTGDDLDDATFLTPEHATTVLPADVAARIPAALLAREQHRTAYLRTPQPATPMTSPATPAGHRTPEPADHPDRRPYRAATPNN